MSDENPMRFIYEFIRFYDEEGIYDEYDPEDNEMVTSEEVQALYEYAKTFVPEPIDGAEAAKRSRELTDVERDAFIAENPTVVIDLRAEFAKKMAANGGARGLLEQMVEARERGDLVEIKRLMDEASDFVRGPNE